MDIWVIDTSSVIHVRRIVAAVQRERVYASLTRLVETGKLVYPVQVVQELERYTGGSKGKSDLPYEWAKKNQRAATRYGLLPGSLKEVLAHPQVRRVVDADKSGTEEADPYVLALAKHLKSQQHDVMVLTEDRRDKPNKLSVVTACGLLRLVPLGIEAFLQDQNIWPK